MATSNLTERTLGTILLQSGTGTPDHSAPVGSVYTDKNSCNAYLNCSTGGTGFGSTWCRTLTTNWRGGISFENNGVALTGPSGWNAMGLTAFSQTGGSGLTGANQGVYSTQERLVVNNAGTYLVTANVAVLGVTGNSATFDVGISLNGASPTSANFVEQRVDTTLYSAGSFHVETILGLSASDYVSLAYNAQGQSFLAVSASLYVYEI